MLKNRKPSLLKEAMPYIIAGAVIVGLLARASKNSANPVVRFLDGMIDSDSSVQVQQKAPDIGMFGFSGASEPSQSPNNLETTHSLHHQVVRGS